MEQLSTATSQVLPHIVQVYQPTTATKIHNPQIIHISHQSLQTSSNVTYQALSEPIHIPVNNHMDMQTQHMPTSQNQIEITCQSRLQTLQPIQAQVLQTDLAQSLQIASHVIVPQVPMFKQHVLVNGVAQDYYEFQSYQKDQCIITKVEPGLQLRKENKTVHCITEDKSESELKPQMKQLKLAKIKKKRNKISNPSSWACNIRKLKHQRGEAYINRRGKYVSEKCVRNTKDCLNTCKFKCSSRISDADRELIFKAFYSLNANEKKHFLLNTTGRYKARQSSVTNENRQNRRQYTFKYFFLVRASRYMVCKHFYLGTLAISQKPVYSVHMQKTEINTPKPDGRGVSEGSHHALPPESKDIVRKHILSFKTINLSPVTQFSMKKQYLDPNLNVKQMYNMYTKDCATDNLMPVKLSMYRKIFKNEFNLHFKKVNKLCCKCKEPVSK